MRVLILYMSAGLQYSLKSTLNDRILKLDLILLSEILPENCRKFLKKYFSFFVLFDIADLEFGLSTRLVCNKLNLVIMLNLIDFTLWPPKIML